MRFQFFKHIKRNQVPKQGGGGRQSAIHGMSFWPEFETSLQEMAEKGAAPFEAIELNLTDFDKEFAKAKIKKPMLATLSVMRTTLKALKLDKKVELNRRGDTRIFIVGPEDR